MTQADSVHSTPPPNTSVIEDQQSEWAKGPGDDLEDEHDGREPHGGDDEPSLGWTSTGSTGIGLHPDLVDLEDEHDGAEPDVCGEPDLGSFDRMVDRQISFRKADPTRGLRLPSQRVAASR